MPLLKDLITIPERVHQGDFVLQLTKGVTEPEQTLRDYVVTPQLVDAFSNALGFIQQAVQTGGSKAAYLHGSFGSGKSHFMAVLNLLLAGNTQARSIPELADVVARHSWTHGRKFLLVPYHMIGARDMESGILGQYAEYVRKKHPEAPVPGFYLAEGLFKDARELRQRMGDEPFFAQLNKGVGGTGGGGGGWGEFDSGWDAASFEAAMLEPPNGEERSRLVGDLITQYFSAYRSLAGSGESFVSLDDGLSIMSRHAQALGYDAVILFLDELVLWLASHAADVNFVSREGTKLVKLVEATNPDRPVPLISFVARQRDLRDLVGENLAGAVQLQFSDVLKHWEARFHRITLEDRNLPAIAEKRVLRPVDEAARQTLQATIDDVMKMRKDVLDTLLTTTADREMFRKVYPFSPALVQTLIAVSAALQRERTALKLMLQLLVDRRADLELGQLIPVGDLYDAIAEGDEPFSEGMRLHFDNAKRLYNQRLLPMLERHHGIAWEAIKLGQADPTAAKNLRNDARLLKTLLLGALVPEVESLKGLTAQRLAALNHGTFRSPIPGREAQDVLRKCRDWASEIGEIKITEDQNPVISIQVTGVDIEPILRAAEANDNAGNRRKKIRETLFEQLGIQDAGGLFTTYEFGWRGTRREVELLYENVREMTDDRLRGRSGAWSVVIDFPFDDANFGPADDLARLGAYRGGDTRTLVWLPSFLSNKALADLGRLVVLDYILQGDRFDNYAAHLSFVDRVQAKALARNQLDQLRIKLRSQLEVADGISAEPRDAVSNPLTADQQFQSLDPTLSPRPPVGAEFRSAFESLLGQLFAHQYPAHPEFDTEIKASVIKKVWPEVQKAIESPGQRGFVQDTSTRKLVRAVVNPCQLGQMGETHLLIEPHWQSRFAQSHAREGGGPITVAKLRRWIDTPAPMGLPIELQNLIILAYAASTNRRFTLRGGPIEPTIDSLSDELELREQALPNPTDWDTALQRASSLFGLTLAQTLNAANVGRLVDEVKQSASGKREAVGRLVAQLRDRASRYGAGTAGARQQSAESAQALLATLTQAAEGDVVSSLAAATLNTSEAAVSRTLGQAQACADALTNGNWQLFDVVRDLGDHRREAAAAIMTRLGEVLIADEHVVPFKARLAELERDAMQLLAAAAPAPVQPPAPAPVGPGGTAVPTPLPPVLPLAPGFNGPELVEEKQALHLTGAAAEAALDDLKARMARERDLELTLSWRLERQGYEAMSLSTPQIAAQLERVLASDPSTVALAIRAKARQPWPETLSQRGRQFALRWCESSLAIREALCDAERHDPASAGLVVITPLATHEIAEDIAARLARARVFQPEGWDIVRQLFQAKETDARLGRYAWMPQSLIDGAAQGPYPPVANGVLGLETAWQEVLQRFLLIPTARPDAVSLLTWSMTAGADATLDQLPAAARTDVMRWLGETAGSAGEMVLGCVEAGRIADALPLGLVCGVVFAPEGEGQAALGQAAIRLERFVNDKHIGVSEGRAWARAAEQVVRAAGLEATRATLDRADALLRDLRVAEFAHLSDLLPAALDQRMQDFALALSAHVAEPTQANLAQVELQADRALRHTLMEPQPPRAERVEMARRLARWLMSTPRPATSLQTAVTWQADEGAFVDWARFRLLGGDEIPDLSQAYSACREALIARRNKFAKPFAQALIEWNANKPALDGRLVPVESVLEHVLAPIAAAHPTLLLVMDGLSISIFRELFARSASHGWAEMAPSDIGQPLVGVAALPTVTEVSRTSLLCGRLTLGAAAQEKAGFASHAALLAHSRAGAPPRLFHKGDLADATNLSPEVRAAIADPHQRVIGVVYNAVDDHLSGPDQLHQRWTLEDLRLLLPLLREAREARRVVVITADHGHLLEDGTAQLAGGESDRWRPGMDSHAPHEVAVSGGRVVTSDGSNTVVCLWGESTRYGGRKNGYHGGLSPQEVTVPLSVIVPLGMNLPGWTPAPPAQPEWWELPPIAKPTKAKPAIAPPARPTGRKPTAQAGQPELFDPTELPLAPAPTAPDWINALLSGTIYSSQRQLAARVALPDEKMRLLLTALSERGGKLSRAALAQRLSLPEIRLGGMLSAVRRMLNVDQAPVLVIDEAAGTVELNIALLQQQFRVVGHGGQR